LLALSALPGFAEEAERDSTLYGSVSFIGMPPSAMIVYFPEDRLGTDLSPRVDQIAKTFLTPMTVARPGETVFFRNSDSINHNIYISNPQSLEEVDLGVAKPGVELSTKITWPINSLINVGCKIHSQMKMQLFVTDSAYYTVVPLPRRYDLSTHFTIAGVPNNYRQVSVQFSDQAVQPLSLQVEIDAPYKISIFKGQDPPREKGLIELRRNQP
jgi:plastocyanin